MPPSLAYTTFLVEDYDPALRFFCDVLNFVVREDRPVGEDRRWIVVAPSAQGGALLIAKASTPEQKARIGDQSGGRVWLFLHTDDFARDHERLIRFGVRFEAPPRDEPYGRVAVFADPWGNRWDLIQPAHP